MAKVILGTELKLLVNIEKVGDISMKDMDFTIDVISQGLQAKTLTFPKEKCKPENGGLNGYRVPFDTAQLGVGKITLRVTAYLPDGDFEDGKRTEITDLNTGIDVVKRL